MKLLDVYDAEYVRWLIVIGLAGALSNLFLFVAVPLAPLTGFIVFVAAFLFLGFRLDFSRRMVHGLALFGFVATIVFFITAIARAAALDLPSSDFGVVVGMHLTMLIIWMVAIALGVFLARWRRRADH